MINIINKGDRTLFKIQIISKLCQLKAKKNKDWIILLKQIIILN